PRVGDGLLLLDRNEEVVYASPHALAAYRRLGLTADLVGARLERITRELAAPGGARDEKLTEPARGRARAEAAGEARGRTAQRPPDQGPHDQGDPPPGEEQSPDGGGVAASSVPEIGQPRGTNGAGRGRGACRLHRHRARDAVAHP